MRHILGISAFYHDSAAALIRDGEIIAAAQEERFSRRKNDESFPLRATEFCLRQASIDLSQLDAVVFYEKPILKFTRALETFLAIAPLGFRSFVEAVPTWLAEKLNMRKTIRAELNLPAEVPILFTDHHTAHAASAFFPSPFQDAAILTVDGVGEYATTRISGGSGHTITDIQEIDFPHSLGLLYSAFTVYSGFRVNSGEYKLMGLAPYGQPKFVNQILEHLIDLKADGSFRLNLDYFDFLRGRRMINEKFNALFGGPPRTPEGPFEERHFDVARSIQDVTELAILRLARRARELTSKPNLCLAGGVALNCVANGKILCEKIFDKLWIQPAAGDAGGALGAALAAWHYHLASRGETSRTLHAPDSMKGSLLGPGFTDAETRAALEGFGAVYTTINDPELIPTVAAWLASGKVIGWVQGRMEFGPRALGNRSILGDPRSPEMQRVLNLKVKQRESFRPFAPAVLQEKVSDFFELDTPSPYMLLVADVKKELRSPKSTARRGLDQINEIRSTLPAITHVDYSARVQTVSHEVNPRFHALLQEFGRLTGFPVLVNTSFNIRGEPIVCTPQDAYRCFMQTEMDYLVIGNFVIERALQPERQKTQSNIQRVLD